MKESYFLYFFYWNCFLFFLSIKRVILKKIRVFYCCIYAGEGYFFICFEIKAYFLIQISQCVMILVNFCYVWFKSLGFTCLWIISLLVWGPSRGGRRGTCPLPPVVVSRTDKIRNFSKKSPNYFPWTYLIFMFYHLIFLILW